MKDGSEGNETGMEAKKEIKMKMYNEKERNEKLKDGFRAN